MLFSLTQIKKFFYGGSFVPDTYAPATILDMESIVDFCGDDLIRMHQAYQNIEYRRKIPCIYKPSDDWQSPTSYTSKMIGANDVQGGYDHNPAYYTQLARNTVPLAIDVLGEANYQSRKAWVLPYSLIDFHKAAFEEPYADPFVGEQDWEHRSSTPYLMSLFSFYEGPSTIKVFFNDILERVSTVILSFTGLKAMQTRR